jgi:uncharacterized membrane protein
MNSGLLIAISFVLILAGFLVPFLMVLGVLESGFTLSFSAYFSSLVGLLLALYGVFDYTNSRQRDDK